jgi:trans-4-hydroxy-L-proline dehydratase
VDDELKQRIMAGDDSLCFIERETLLHRYAGDAKELPQESRYQFLLNHLLAGLSCPVDEHDVFLGRMLEGPRPEDSLPCPFRCELETNGHMTLDWESLLKHGLSEIVGMALRNAGRLATEDAKVFASNARLCVEGLMSFSKRYSEEAIRKAQTAKEAKHKISLLRSAAALEKVPGEAASSLFEALQSIWLVHLVTSSIGARDFAFGRMDRYLLPFYERDLREGLETRDSAKELLANFLLKCNEITGLTTWNHKSKPIPCNSSKQYLMLGGGDGGLNELSEVILEAAAIVKMPEPVISVRLCRDHSGREDGILTSALKSLGSQLNFFNDDVIVPELRRGGVAEADALNYGMVGCCRVDLPGMMDDGMMKTYLYHNVAQWLTASLNGVSSSEDILEKFAEVASNEMRKGTEASIECYRRQTPRQFHIESLLLRGCVERCLDHRACGCDYIPIGHFWGAIASAGNILASIDKLVFKERRFGLEKFLAIAKEDFTRNPELLSELKEPSWQFGNDNPQADRFCVSLGNILVEELDKIREEFKARSPKSLLLSGFYSLDSHHRWGREMSGTPDGRVAGEPFSENQSPSYGSDVSGPTATLKSVSRLPLARTAMGGLNLKFNGEASERHIALLRSYFALGGIHLGFTFTDRTTLLAAKRTPCEHRSLCVRMYGFSEYFVSLSPEEQEELIRRTSH